MAVSMSRDSKSRSRVKRWHSKTRTGCLNCRKRRVKCSEHQPCCDGCKRNFLECVYPTKEPSQIILDPHTTKHASSLQFFTEQSLPMLCGVALGPEKSLIIDRVVWKRVYEPFSGMWRRLAMQVAFSEPPIAQLVSLYASRHRFSIEAAPVHEHDHYARMLSATKRAVDSASPEVGAVAAMVFFAYERLRSAASGATPLDMNHAHMRLITEMGGLKQAGAVQKHIRPSFESVKAMLELFHVEGEATSKPVSVPPLFTSCSEARANFQDILNFHRAGGEVNGLFDQWSSRMLEYHNSLRDVDQNMARSSMAMLTEFHLLRTMFDLSILVQRSPTDPLVRSLKE